MKVIIHFNHNKEDREGCACPECRHGGYKQVVDIEKLQPVKFEICDSSEFGHFESLNHIETVTLKLIPWIISSKISIWLSQLESAVRKYDETKNNEYLQLQVELIKVIQKELPNTSEIRLAEILCYKFMRPEFYEKNFNTYPDILYYSFHLIPSEHAAQLQELMIQQSLKLFLTESGQKDFESQFAVRDRINGLFGIHVWPKARVPQLDKTKPIEVEI